MTKIDLRDYQLDIINQTINSDKYTLIQVPTGGGKTIIAKEIAKYLTNNLNQQVLFVAPKIVLMKQTAKVFQELNPHIIHKNNHYDKKHKILVSTIQTASRRDINPDVLIIDEIHHGFKGKMIQALIQKPNTRVIGLSATPYDEDGNMLKGFELVLNQYDIKYMVENNYLTNIKPLELVEIKKLESVKITNGDYDLQELSKIMCNNRTVLEIVGSTFKYIINYKKTIVFAVDINHAELLAKAYQEEGFIAKAIHSKLDSKENAQDIEKFKNGEIQILVSVLMLTTGFDVPDVEVAVLARPTKSQNLYKQMVGRVLRKAENKTHAILLDCGNVIENLGKPLDPIKAIKKQETSNSKQKCKICESENLKLKHKDDKSFWECRDCGHVRNIEHGTYECKNCHKLYAYARDRFSIKSNKLHLNCDNCPDSTFISEYTGNEIFVEVTNKTEEKINPNKSLVKILEEKKKKELEKEEVKVKSTIKESDREVSTAVNKGSYSDDFIYKASEEASDDAMLKLFDKIFTTVQNDHSVSYDKKLSYALALFKVEFSGLSVASSNKKVVEKVTKDINLIIDSFIEGFGRYKLHKVLLLDKISYKTYKKVFKMEQYINKSVLKALKEETQNYDEKLKAHLEYVSKLAFIHKTVQKESFIAPTGFVNPLVFDENGRCDHSRISSHTVYIMYTLLRS